MIVPSVRTSNQRRFPWDPAKDGAPVVPNLRRFVASLPEKIRPRTWAKIVGGDGRVIVHLNLKATAPTGPGP